MSQDASSARRAANRLFEVSILARYTRKRRLQMGLTVEQAAELAGLRLCDWAALEAGWVPDEDEHDVIRAIAETLEVRWPELSLMAVFARSAQQALHR